MWPKVEVSDALQYKSIWLPVLQQRCRNLCHRLQSIRLDFVLLAGIAIIEFSSLMRRECMALR